MLGTILWLIYGGVTHFNAGCYFASLAGTWSLSLAFLRRPGPRVRANRLQYLGYYNVCNLGGEMKDPERNIPLAIFISIFGIAALYLAMQASVLSVVPWQEVAQSRAVVSIFVERAFGGNWATLATAIDSR